MKYLLTILILSGISLNLEAQIEKPISKGNTILLGDLSIDYTHVPEDNQRTRNLNMFFDKAFSSTFNPGVAFFVIDKLAVGPILNLGYYKTVAGTQESRIGLGPVIRYYLFNGLYVKTEAVCQLRRYWWEERKSSGIFHYLSPGLGYSFFLNQNVSLDPCFHYYFDSDNLYSDEWRELSSNSNFRFTVGISVYL